LSKEKKIEIRKIPLEFFTSEALPAPNTFGLCENKRTSATNKDGGVVMCSKYDPGIEFEKIFYGKLKDSHTEII